MKNGLVRLAVLLAWAVAALFVGGIASRSGVSPAVVGGLELLAIAVGTAVVIATPAWRRSIARSREQAGTRY